MQLKTHEGIGRRKTYRWKFYFNTIKSPYLKVLLRVLGYLYRVGPVSGHLSALPFGLAGLVFTVSLVWRAAAFAVSTAQAKGIRSEEGWTPVTLYIDCHPLWNWCMEWPRARRAEREGRREGEFCKARNANSTLPRCAAELQEKTRRPRA